MALGTGLIVLAALSMTGVSDVSGVLTYFQTFPSRDENNEVVYEYRYSVDDQISGVINDRWEQRQGQFVKGSYSLLDPSGKVRTVSYEVDGPRGFVAVVKTTFPAAVLYSTQQLSRSLQQYPDPAVNLRRSAPPPGATPSYNYHAHPYTNHNQPRAAPPFTSQQPVNKPQPLQQGFQSGFQGGGRSRTSVFPITRNTQGVPRAPNTFLTPPGPPQPQPPFRL